MKDGFLFIIKSVIYFPSSLFLKNFPLLISRRMGTISNTKLAPQSFHGITFCDLPGQPAKLIGLSKSLIAYSDEEIDKKIAYC